MDKNTRRAGRPAKWRTIVRQGEAVLVSPTGETWRGTAADVRRAALFPWDRDWLAETIRAKRIIYQRPDRYSEEVKDARRSAILSDLALFRYHSSVGISNWLRVMARAAARYMGQSEDQFISEAILAAIEGTMDICQNDTGTFTLPMTRYEQKALNR